MNNRIRLKKLYMESSKHSNYQILPSCLKSILPYEELNIKSRWERERLNYIQNHLKFENKKVLDIGGNTGFFSFEAITAGASHVDYYEGNKSHAEFVKVALETVGMEKKITIYPEFYLFEENKRKYDITLCLNVLHHLGADFESGCSKETAKKKMLSCINELSLVTTYLVLQLGFNWYGNKDICLFENGTKQEMEQYVVNGTKGLWELLHIGIAEKQNDEILYSDLNYSNNIRNDELGEFLNRPIFIMKAKR